MRRRAAAVQGRRLLGGLAQRLHHWLTYRPERRYMRGPAGAVPR